MRKIRKNIQKMMKTIVFKKLHNLANNGARIVENMPTKNYNQCIFTTHRRQYKL